MQNTITIVFGGTKGIGKVISKTLSKRGDLVITSSRTNLNKQSHLSIDLSSKKPRIKSCISRYFKNKNFKINNIVFSQKYRGNEPNLDFKVMLNSTSFIIELLKNKMIKGSSIVLLSSIAIKTIVDDQPLNYHVTRAGIEQMTRFYAVALGHKEIRCNCVLHTRIIKPENYKFYNKKNNPITTIMKKITPLNRMGNAQDVANLVEFLTSEKSSFVTGCTIPVDGGAHLQSQELIAKKFYQKKR